MKGQGEPVTPPDILAFYRGEARNTMGYRLDQILHWNFQDLEDQHDYIQWLFPTPAPSDYNPDAPLLAAEDIAPFRSDPWLRQRLRRSFVRFLAFLGLSLLADGRVVQADDFEDRRRAVWVYFNHNWLRVSRVLTSLMVLGLQTEARAFFAWLHEAYDQGKIGSCVEESRTQAAVSHEHWFRRVNGLAESGDNGP